MPVSSNSLPPVSPVAAQGPRTGPAKISVVVPLFNEEENVPELYRRLVRSLEQLGGQFELVFVDDGSKDRTAELLDSLSQNDPRLVVVHFSRNFGHQAAVTAGLAYATGQAVFVMDGDLQDPPEVLGEFVAKWREGYDVVYAVRTKRKEGPFKRLAYFLFYRLLRSISNLDIPLDSGDFCLMDRRVVDVMNHLPEKLRFVRGLRTFVGFRQVGLEYERDARAAGDPKYTFRKLVGLALDGLVSFSDYPLHLVTYLGCGCVLLALLGAAWAGLDAFLNESGPRGWAITSVVVLFLGAIQLLSLGIVGEYVRRIYLETKGRPQFIVRDAFQSQPPEGGHRLAGPHTNGLAGNPQATADRPAAPSSPHDSPL